MRSPLAFLSFYLIVATCLGFAGAHDPRRIVPRASKDAPSATSPSFPTFTLGGSSSAVPSTHRFSPATSSIGSLASAEVQSTEASRTKIQEASGTSTVAASTDSPSSSSTFGTVTSTVAQATYSASNDLDQLPIKPAITPALSIAGAILTLTGVVYTLIGIRTKWLHIFLSSAYLVSLAVTVLIIYVMHPPVTNAIQGAYFAAAFVTGVVFGIGSVVFADLTECLGCLLGGFCLGMWFLVLKSGGLVETTVGRIVLIACFALATFALYFHQFTRPYGLIGSTSFAGATVVVIGIDCFSRAGLKEFWIYIWSLNDDLFPPHYSTPYPVTRGIQVEIAAIVLFFLVGVMSQLKVWKVVKKRRERKEAFRHAGERKQAQAELDLGRRLEEGTIQEKIKWEAAYGERRDRKHTDSGFGADAIYSPRRASAVGHEETNFGKPDLEYATGKGTSKHPPRAQGPTRITVRVASDDSLYDLPSSTTENLLLRQPQEQEGPTKPHIPEGDDRSSIATFAASDRIPSRMSQAAGGKGLVRESSRYSKRRSNQSAHVKDTRPSPDDDDRASIAATVDEFGDGASSKGEVPDFGTDANPSDDNVNDPPEALLSGAEVVPLTAGNLEAGSNIPVEGSSGHIHFVKKFIESDGHGTGREASNDRGRGYIDHSLKPTSPSPPPIPERSPSRVSMRSFQAVEERASLDAIHDQLPEGASKVVTAYRTNEWAKYLEQAEPPIVDDMKNHTQSADADLDSTEAAAPVHIEALQQTPLNAEPLPLQTKGRSRPQQLDLTRSPSSRDALPSQQKYTHPNTNLRRSSMGRILDRTSSQTYLSRHSKHRSSSTPMNTSPLAQSPIEEDVEMSFPKRMSAHPTNSMMAQRSSKIQTRSSTNPLGRASSYNPLTSPLHPQSLPKRHSFSRPQLTPRTSATLISSTETPQTRQSVTANWRSSLQQDPRASNQALSQELDGKRAELLRQQRRASFAEAERVQREDAEKGARMSRGDLMEAHQRAMRKLQGSVKH